MLLDKAVSLEDYFAFFKIIMCSSEMYELVRFKQNILCVCVFVYLCRCHAGQENVDLRTDLFGVISLCRCPVYHELPPECTLVGVPNECCLKPVCNFNQKLVTSEVAPGPSLNAQNIRKWILFACVVFFLLFYTYGLIHFCLCVSCLFIYQSLSVCLSVFVSASGLYVSQVSVSFMFSCYCILLPLFSLSVMGCYMHRIVHLLFTFY